ncbi:CheY-like chemotaxis protein [Mycoplana sp. BE70]|uniref:response regulator n=1 Tax=Mycoplana sp. BE70 TaxID=2817775 RepID=UPI00285F1768|nr:response regulator [Mycoplana sp. BE70]MDR6757591.1 CheY-like chemotaxis protein [Mycoplana sp. BE70]
MPISDRILPYLPGLRRYARALTGSQSSGDAYVAATLEVALSDPLILQGGHDGDDDRLCLFRLLSRMIATLPLSLSVSVPVRSGPEAPFDFAAVAPQVRQALLLVTMEGFPTTQAAAILELDEAEVCDLLTIAYREIAAQAETGIMIIEDEPLIALDLADLITDMGHHVTGIARTKAEAEQLWGDTLPGLILADVKLADGSSGIDAVNSILSRTDLPVIFVTAYPERLLTGERPEPAYLVSKPFHPETIKVLINQALLSNQSQRAAA